MTSEWWQRVSREQYGCRVYLPVFFCHVKPWAATGGLTDKGPAGWRGVARLSDGCPIHHGGPCWWAKEPTWWWGRGGQWGVSTLWLLQIHHADKSSTESVCVVTAGRMASSTLGKEQCADQEKKVMKGSVRMTPFRGFGESTLSKRGFWNRTLCCQIERRSQLRRYQSWVYFLCGKERSIYITI